MLFAVTHFAALRGEHVVIAGSRHVRNHHAGFHAFLEVYVFVKGDVRPVIDELNMGVAGAYTVDTPKTLNNTHGVPVYVVIDQVVTVLKILPFRNTVRTDKQINLMRFTRQCQRLFFADRRKKR